MEFEHKELQKLHIWSQPNREGLSESGRLTHEHPTLSGPSENITAAIVLLECAEDKLFSLLPWEEFAAT
jgi:hypothetical protein